jgi:hypothetical protein
MSSLDAMKDQDIPDLKVKVEDTNPQSPLSANYMFQFLCCRLTRPRLDPWAHVAFSQIHKA